MFLLIFNTKQKIDNDYILLMKLLLYFDITFTHYGLNKWYSNDLMKCSYIFKFETKSLLNMMLYCTTLKVLWFLRNKQIQNETGILSLQDWIKTLFIQFLKHIQRRPVLQDWKTDAFDLRCRKTYYYQTKFYKL